MEPLNGQFPRLNLHNGQNKPSTLHLARGVKLRLPPSQTNIILLLIEERRRSKRLDHVDRGWIDVDRLHERYFGLTARHIEARSVNKYANRTLNRIEALLEQRLPTRPPMIESSAGRGFRITTAVVVLESDGEEWSAGA